MKVLDDKTALRYAAALFILELSDSGKLEQMPEDMVAVVRATKAEMQMLDDDDLPMEEFLRYALGIRH